MRVYLSCTYKNGVLVGVVSCNGMCVKKSIVEASRGTGAGTVFFNLIDAYSLGFRLLKSVVEHNSSISEVIIETGNKSFLSWLKKGYCPQQYTDLFLSMLMLLDSVPVRYNFVLTNRLVALNYANIRYVSKDRLVGFDF